MISSNPFKMEAIEVTARFDRQGKAFPTQFQWKGRLYPVASIGRSWLSDNGFHILVMTADNAVYHLFFDSRAAQWYLVPRGEIPSVWA